MSRINLEIKRNNILNIFRTIQKCAPIDRRELELATKLSWGTVSAVCSELIAANYIETYKEPAHGAGRIPDKLIISPCNYCLGIDINIMGLTFVVCDLSGNAMTIKFVDLISNKKDDILMQLRQETGLLLAQYSSVLNISISLQGYIDKKRGISVNVDPFDGWNNIPIVDLFQEEFHIPTYLYHDPDCLLAYHLHINQDLPQNTDSCAVIKLDKGIGMALYLSDQVFESSDGVVAELGHICVQYNGLPCQCGRNGCLEAYCSMLGLTNIYNTENNTDLSAEEFAELLNQEDACAISILRQNMVYLGIALANLSNLVNPKLLIFDGMMTVYARHYMDIVEQVLYENTTNRHHFYLASYQRQSAAQGASIKTINKNLYQILFHNEDLA